MKTLLEDLWYSYCLETDSKMGKEEKQLLSRLVKEEDALRAVLTEGQRSILERYENAVDDLRDLAERQAFLKGVRLAAHFLFESFW
ncbi:MAG: hypothetical protein IJY20_08030 [Clostridia bacterium]|nr:hypothetical protein [Clostridia bacterium]